VELYGKKENELWRQFKEDWIKSRWENKIYGCLFCICLAFYIILLNFSGLAGVKSEILAGCLFVSGFGVLFIFKGFIELKAKRTVQDIPTSKIATGAVGTNVEIIGRVISSQNKLLSSPLTNTPCVFYAIKILISVDENEQLIYFGDRAEKGWRAIDIYFSADGFYVEDESDATALMK